MKSRLVVVLGMHRSGTSAITRGLQVLGVSLGETLGAMPGVNEKGFWEDIHLNALDVEMLSAINSDWFHVQAIDSIDIGTLHKQGYFLHAVELLREKVGSSAIFAFKDPRVAKLLPFWKGVFAHCDFDVDYVLAVRNPLSVVKSLTKRDGLDAEQSYLLWLGHVLTSLTYSAGKKRVLVDYDRLMQSPDYELNRIAKHLYLEIDQTELQTYKTEFLDEGLRHTLYNPSDLLLDEACPQLVHEVYSALLEVASDNVGFDGLESKIASWSVEFERLKSPLMLIDKLLVQKKVANQAVAERESQIVGLNQAVAERDSQIVNLNQAVAEREGQVVNLNQAVAEREGQIVNFNQVVAEREGQIAALTQAMSERATQIVSLNQVIAELSAQYLKITHCKSWVITKPVRWFGRVLRGEFEAALDPFKKMQKSNDKVASTLEDGVQTNAVQTEILRVSDPIEPTHPVAVIVPVYRGVEMTMRCIMAAMPSILSNSNAKLLAVNDASPSEGMQEMLEQLALKWPNEFLVLKNEKNLGFVCTVNRGLAYFSEYDVVLLNSDVVVPEDWLSRLVADAYSRANVGTVTPFSNNATICSFPYFLQENAQPLGLEVNDIDATFRYEKLPCIEAPTGVGFCMYIRRTCLDQIGYLNEEKFGRGYGEENDLCQRALKNGWVNLISPNVYAFHEGGVSFLSDKQALVDRATRVIGELHPNYHADVQRFIEADPIKSVRILRCTRLLATISVPKILHVSHSMGGGIKQHVDELDKYFSKKMANILLTPQGVNGAVRISLGISPNADSMIFNMPTEYDKMLGLLKALGISAVHFHHTHGLDHTILRIAEDLGAVCLITVHDYYWLCANPTLTNEAGIYPGYYSGQLRNPLHPLPSDETLETWQARLRPFIEGADCVIYPSQATRCIFENVYHPANSVVVPHIEQQLNVNTPVRPFIKKAHYMIGVLGAIGREKGADLLEELAIKAEKAGANFNFKLVGYAYRPLKQVDTTGPYETKDLSGLIHENDLDILFFAARCPETYSYTLSYALDSGLPIVASHLGAFPERLTGRANTLLFNHLDTSETLLVQLNVFVAALEEGDVMSAPVIDQIAYKEDFYNCDYPELVSRKLKIVKTNSHEWMEQVGVCLLGSTQERRKAPWQESFAHLLWRLRMDPKLHWLSNAVPRGIRRRVRLALSHCSNDDLARGRKGG